eukprot:Hpha_TRINITY_DN16531_c3_g1::TRINITY_DN16531_c3_g1_i2::g.136362::m.136362
MPSVLPAPERLALRNSLAVFGVFAALKALRTLRRGKEKLTSGRQDDWDETINTSAAAGLSAEMFARGQTLTGSSLLGSLMSFASLRALCDNDSYHFNYRFVVAYLTAQVLVSQLPKTRLRNVIVMMVSASQLLGWWILSDRHLPRDYVRFLDRKAKINKPGVRAKDGTLISSQLLDFRETFSNEDGTRKWSDLLSLVFPDPPNPTLSEKFGARDSVLGFHKAAAAYFLIHLRESLPLYANVYGLRFLVGLLRGGGKKMDLQFVARTVKDILRSSTFLATYVTSAMWTMGVAGYLLPGGPSPKSPLMWVVLGLPGLSILVESESQQLTIANYCATFGIYPLFAQFPLLCDAAAALTAAACASGVAPRPALLNLLWPADPAGESVRSQRAVSSK